METARFSNIGTSVPDHTTFIALLQNTIVFIVISVRSSTEIDDAAVYVAKRL